MLDFDKYNFIGYAEFNGKKIYRKINNSEFKRKPLEPSLRKSLQDDLKKEIDELSLMLKKDLSYWYKN